MMESNTMHTSKEVAQAHAKARKGENEFTPLTDDERQFVTALGTSLGLTGAELDEFIQEANADPDHSAEIADLKEAGFGG